MSADLSTTYMANSCSRCNKEVRETIARLKDNPVIICPGCGFSWAIDKKQIAYVAEHADKISDQVKSVKRKLGDFD